MGNRFEEDLRRAYGSFSNPNFSFVQRALEQRPYRGLIENLETVFTVEEDTDPNDDVSVGFLLTDRQKCWLLRISMVGPYAVLLPLDSRGIAGEPIIISADDEGAEAQILERLKNEGVAILGRNELEQPVRIRLFNAGLRNTRIFQALFQDTDILPWRSSR